MKAMEYLHYGDINQLQYKEIEKVIPANNQVLIRVIAASVNSWDWDLLRGVPYLTRLDGGLFKPKHSILGCDVAGTIEAVGKEVKTFKVGDAVFGDLSGGNWGAFAEYVCADESEIKLKPAKMSFEQAAALPQASTLALQGVQKKPLQAGDKALINGAAGGVGTTAIQMLKARGVEVTAIDHPDKHELLKSLGADFVIDYTREDFTRNGQGYDLVLDMITDHSLLSYLPALKKGGAYVVVGGKTAKIFQFLFFGWLVSKISGKYFGLLLHKANKGLDQIIEFFEQGTINPVIDKQYPLNQTAMALQQMGNGTVKGKLVIQLDNPGEKPQ